MVADSIFYVLVVALPIIALAIVVAVVVYIRRNRNNTDHNDHLISPQRYDPGKQQNQFIISDSPPSIYTPPSDGQVLHPQHVDDNDDMRSVSLSPSPSSS